MSAKDTVAKVYFSNLDRVAELFNYVFRQKETPITSSNLSRIDPAQYGMRKGEGTQLVTDNRFQDLLFDVTLPGGDKPRKLLFSLEIQSRQEWDMAIRMHHYNARQYMLQAKYGLLKDRHQVLPIYNLVLNLSNAPWREALFLHELYPYQDKGVLYFSSDYRSTVLDAWRIKEKSFPLFSTDMGFVLYCHKHSGDAKHLFEKSMVRFTNIVLSNDAIDFLNVYHNLNLPYPTTEEDYTVCKAVRDFRRQVIAEGKAKWLAEGREQGLVQGREQGLVQGREQGRVQGREQGLVQGREQGREQGLVQGREQGRAECRFEMFQQFAQSCLLNGLSAQEIAGKLIDIFKATDAEVELLLRPVN